MEHSFFMRFPAELRFVVYENLFIDAGHQRLMIRNCGASKTSSSKQDLRRRYYVGGRSFHRQCYETTYQLHTDSVIFCCALMRVNRKIYHETSYLVYGKHSFDFGGDIEAIEPFLTDLTPTSRRLVQDISLYKRGRTHLYDQDGNVWCSLCRFLESNGAVRKLRLVLQGGKPSKPWDGPKKFSASDFQFLSNIKHESLDWVSDLARVRGIEELEILPDVHYCPAPESTNMIIFAAFSASIDAGFTEFLRTQLLLAVEKPAL